MATKPGTHLETSLWKDIPGLWRNWKATPGSCKPGAPSQAAAISMAEFDEEKQRLVSPKTGDAYEKEFSSICLGKTDGLRVKSVEDEKSEQGIDSERAADETGCLGQHLRGLNFQVILAIVGFSVCSSTMLVVNKVAIHLVPAPSLVLLFQLATAAASVFAMDAVKVVEADKLELAKVRQFSFVAFAFLGGLYSNIKVLQYANVETFIAIRSTTPILISLLDYLFMGRELPSYQSTLSLSLIVSGTTGYMLNDSNFELRTYSWVVIWLAIFVFDQVYIKYIVDTVQMTTWGRVYYTNLIASFPVAVLGSVSNEWSVLRNVGWEGATMLLLSCAIGVAMNYSAFNCRKIMSATSFTVVGTLCKILSVVVNMCIWSKHASVLGIAYLFIGILAGLFYRQAPLRSTANVHASKIPS